MAVFLEPVEPDPHAAQQLGAVGHAVFALDVGLLELLDRVPADLPGVPEALVEEPVRPDP